MTTTTDDEGSRRAIPPVPRLKDQAERMRARAAGRGETMSRAEALEALARLMGLRDWNTLRALAARGPEGAPLEAEEKVWARVMGAGPVAAKVLRVREGGKPGLWRIEVAFAAPLVAGDRLPAVFEGRERMSAEIDGNGISAGRLSSGAPHLALELR